MRRIISFILTLAAALLLMDMRIFGAMILMIWASNIVLQVPASRIYMDQDT